MCVSFSCRGYGFVKFTDELEQKRALTECQGAIGLGSKPVRLSVAIPKAWVLRWRGNRDMPRRLLIIRASACCLGGCQEAQCRPQVMSAWCLPGWVLDMSQRHCCPCRSSQLRRELWLGEARHMENRHSDAGKAAGLCKLSLCALCPVELLLKHTNLLRVPLAMGVAKN